MTAIVDYRAGNLTSVRLAFEAIGAPATVTADPAAIRAAERAAKGLDREVPDSQVGNRPFARGRAYMADRFPSEPVLFLIL